VRAVWTGTQLVTRNGNKVYAPDWFTCALPSDMMLDGELWVGYGNSNFNAVNGLVRSLNPNDHLWRSIKYMVFDAPSESGDLMWRLDTVRRKVSADHVHRVTNTPVVDMQALEATLAFVRGQGGEGLMLRDPAAPYAGGRSKKMLKMKVFDETEAMVIGYNWLSTTKPKRSLECSLVNTTNAVFSVTISEEVKAAPPPIGSLVTVKYFELTQKGVPRFPSFKAVRTDV
jgi:DNA ligase-1